MKTGIIDTVIRVNTDKDVRMFTLPYTSHLTHDDLHDNKDQVFRFAFGTTDTKLNTQRTFSKIVGMMPGRNLELYPWVTIQSKDRTIKMRNAAIIITKKFGEVYVEIESVEGDVNLHAERNK